MSDSGARSTVWNFIIYPDSLPDDWQEIIVQTHVPCIISPCHNLDVFTKSDEDKAKKYLNQMKEAKNVNMDCYKREVKRLLKTKQGVQKKPHYHAICRFDTLKSKQQVISTFCEPLNGNMFPQVAQSERGSVRYLIHMDNTDKAQYRLDEIKIFNGYDTEDFFDLSSKELSKIPRAVQELIEQYDVQSYSHLCNICKVYQPWYNYCINNTYFLTNYIKSRVEAVHVPDFVIEAQQNGLLDLVDKHVSLSEVL